MIETPVDYEQDALKAWRRLVQIASRKRQRTTANLTIGACARILEHYRWIADRERPADLAAVSLDQLVAMMQKLAALKAKQEGRRLDG